MAIQHRRGKYSDFDPSKLLPGELAIVLSGDPASGTGRSVYVCFETGVVKRFATYEDFETEIQNATEDVQAAFTEEIRSAINSAITAANSANTAVEAANKATAAANEAAEAANAVVLGDISKNTVTFTQAEERTLPESGEDTATLFGKIKKWLADLAKVAFSGSYDDLSDKPTLGKAAEMEVANNDTTTSEGYVADARAVNLLGEEIDETNEELDTLKSSFDETNEKLETLENGFDELNTKIIVETVAATINASADYTYIPAKDGYHLVSAVNESFADTTDVPIGITWYERFYVVFFKSASAEAATKNLILTWVKKTA